MVVTIGRNKQTLNLPFSTVAIRRLLIDIEDDPRFLILKMSVEKILSTTRLQGFYMDITDETLYQGCVSQ